MSRALLDRVAICEGPDLNVLSQAGCGLLAYLISLSIAVSYAEGSNLSHSAGTIHGRSSLNGLSHPDSSFEEARRIESVFDSNA